MNRLEDPVPQSVATSGSPARRRLAPVWPGAVLLAGGSVAMAGLYSLSQHNYLLFHTLTELGAVAVAWSVFLLVWGTRCLKAPPGFVMLGIGYLFVGVLDILHTLAFEGMGVFGHPEADLAAQLWIAARSIEAATLLLFPFGITREVVARSGGVALAIMTGFLLGSLFVWDGFPVCFDAETGLTPFKKGSEYLLMAAFAGAALLTWRKRSLVGKSVAPLLIASMLVTVASEFAFTLYDSLYGSANMVGHLLKVGSFGLIYLALVQSAVTRPYATMFRDLTDTNRRLATLMGNLPGMAYRCLNTENWPMQFVSQGSADLTGYPADALTSADGVAYGDLIDPDDRDGVWRAVQESLESGRHFEIEYRIHHKDGHLRWVWERGLLVGQDEAGCGVLEGFIGDITMRKEAERHLQYQATISKQVSDAIIATDLDLRITSWNPAATRIYGWTEAEATGEHVIELLRTQWLDPQWEEVRAILLETGAWKGEVRQKSKDGRDLIIEASVSWIRDADGNIVGEVIANRDMTAQEALRSRLLQERNLLQGILDSSLDHLVVVDRHGLIQEVNRAWRRFADENGASDAACSIGASYLEPVRRAVLAGDRHAIRFEQEFARLARHEQESFSMEYPCHAPQQQRWFRLQAVVMRNPSGSVLINHTDITIQMEAQEALRASEERYRSIVSALPDLLFRIDSDLRFTDVQTSMPGMLLAPIEKIIGRTAWELLPPDIAELTRQKVRAALNTRQIQIYHYALEQRGENRECETRMVPCGVNEVLSIVRDVTEARQAERRLRESEARYMAVVNDQTELICRFTNDGTLTFVNEAYCRYFARKPQDLLDRLFSPMIPDEDREAVRNQSASLCRTHPIVNYEHRVIRPDGSMGWMEWTDRAIYDDAGCFVEYQGVGQDITERKQLQTRLMEASEREQKRLAEELHDGLCQDLKSLEIEAALLEDATAGLNNGDVAARAAQMGKRINDAVRKAYSIVRGMIPSGLDAEGFSTTLRNLIDQARPATGANIVASIEEALEPDSALQAYHLYRIAQEALANALRHAKASRIEMRWARDEASIVLAVKDDGIGFVEFGEVRDDGGMGILVMRSRAQAIGASIDIQSVVDEGTEVRCILRLRGMSPVEASLEETENMNENQMHSDR